MAICVAVFCRIIMVEKNAAAQLDVTFYLSCCGILFSALVGVYYYFF